MEPPDRVSAQNDLGFGSPAKRDEPVPKLQLAAGVDLRLLEEATANMLPSQQSMVYDGWLLRFNPGKGRNPNSVWPLGPSHLSFEKKIDFCEREYASRGLECSFRLSELEDHNSLQELLLNRGYTIYNPNLVMVTKEMEAADVDVELSDLTLNDWLDLMLRLDPDLKAADIEWKRGPLSNISLPAWYGAVMQDGKVCGYGRSVQQGSLYQIAEIWVSPTLRGRGLGTRLIRGLLERGRQAGAETSFLTVSEMNRGARRLYERLGFGNVYGFRYLICEERKASSFKSQLEPCGLGATADSD